MKTVWKYELDPFSNLTDHKLPKDAAIVLVGNQGGQHCIWVALDPEAEKVKRRFQISGTGHPIDSAAIHLGSFQEDVFVWHVWELPA